MRKYKVLEDRLFKHVFSDKKTLEAFYGDLEITLENDNIVSLEAYKSFCKANYKKSLCYLGRLYAGQK